MAGHGIRLRQESNLTYIDVVPRLYAHIFFSDNKEELLVSSLNGTSRVQPLGNYYKQGVLKNRSFSFDTYGKLTYIGTDPKRVTLQYNGSIMKVTKRWSNENTISIRTEINGELNPEQFVKLALTETFNSFSVSQDVNLIEGSTLQVVATVEIDPDEYIRNCDFLCSSVFFHVVEIDE